MADVKITDFPALTDIPDSAVFYVVSGGVDYKITKAELFKKINSYSTTEFKTGGTWIDGKPIYRKVVTSENATDLITFSDVDSVVSIECNFKTDQFLRKMIDWGISLNINANGIYGHFSFNHTYGELEYEVITGASSTELFLNAILILEYTKTTD